MWQILKTEFRYTRDALILAYTIAAIFLVIAVIRDGYGIYNYMWNTTIVCFIFMGITGSSTVNEKRYRYFSTLPVTAEQLTMVMVCTSSWFSLGCVRFGFRIWFSPAKSLHPRSFGQCWQTMRLSFPSWRSSEPTITSVSSRRRSTSALIGTFFSPIP